MPQHTQVSTIGLHVGLVASHPLVVTYLTELLIGLECNLFLVVLRNDTALEQNVLPANTHSVIILDLHDLLLPISTYLDAFSMLGNTTGFIGLDYSREAAEIADLLLCGFNGFLSYGQVPDLLGPAICSVAQGDTWVTPDVLRRYMTMTSHRSPLSDSGTEILTKRESQIRDLLKRRYSNKEIATLLGICESTVKFHVSNVLAKLNATGRRDLTRSRDNPLVLPIFRKCG
jgi:DNA-binding NarL/FixJ family response regulator